SSNLGNDGRPLVEDLFALAKALQTDLLASAPAGAAVIGATGLDGAFGLTGAHDIPTATAGGIAGFAKSLAQEWPLVRSRAVDCEPDTPEAVAARLFDELRAADSLFEVGYRRDGTRQTLKLVPAPATTAHLPVDQDAVVLVTGGA